MPTNWEGGNIVHPKQYFTIRGLNYLNDEVESINENKALKIGYIGTDTTENIRSLWWMNASNMLERVRISDILHDRMGQSVPQYQPFKTRTRANTQN